MPATLAALQAARRGEDFIGGGKFPNARHALCTLDVCPAYDAGTINQELAFELRPLVLHVGAVGFVLPITIELADLCNSLRDGQGFRKCTVGINLKSLERMH